MDYNKMQDYINRADHIKDEIEFQNMIDDIMNNVMKKWITLDSDRRITLSVIPQNEWKVLNLFIDSSMMSFFHDNAMESYSYVSLACLALAIRSGTDSAKRAVYDIIKDTKKFILSDKMNFENLSKEQCIIYDGIIAGYYRSAFTIGEPMDEKVVEVAKKFYESLPKDYPITKSIFYRECWLPLAEKSPQILDTIPRKSKEEYEKIIFGAELTHQGGLQEFKKQYDALMLEYLMFYGNEISSEQKGQILGIIKNSLPAGYMKSSVTYNQYFLLTEGGNDFLRENEGLVLREMLAQVAEKLTYSDAIENLSFTEIENEILKKMSMMDENKKMRRNRYITSLADYIGEDAKEIALYLLRIKPKFEIYCFIYGASGMHLNPTVKDIIGWSLDPDLSKKIFENFDADKINDDSVDEQGLTKFDYADMALSFLIENANNGSKEYAYFTRNRIAQRYEDCGKNIYDSRAARKMAETYIDTLVELSNPGRDRRKEEIILAFVRTVSRKPDFNLFREQEISDFMQLAKIDNRDFIKDVEKEVRQGLSENPAYNMTTEEAQIYVDIFLAKAKERPISDQLEDEFDKFLKAITIIRLDDKRGTFPKHISEYLIRQALNENSIVHRHWNKYACVFERSVENLAVIDVYDLQDDNVRLPIYKIRDYLRSSTTNGSRLEKCISAQRNAIHSILDGELGAMNTVFHENVHFGQDIRLRKLKLQSFNEYMMLKEYIIHKNSPEYYNANYKLIYGEIEARELAAKKTAMFIGAVLTRVIPKKIAAGLGEEDAQSMEAKFKEMQRRYEEESKKESKKYEKGYRKKVGNGEKKTINECFDYYVSASSIASLITQFPALQYEYNEDGSKKTISEQLDFVDCYRHEVNLPVMAEIITRLGEEEFKYDIEVFKQIDLFMKTAHSKEQIDFINKIGVSIIPLAVDKYSEDIQSGRKLDKNKYYSSYVRISSILEQLETEEGAKKFCDFTIENKNGVVPAELLKKAKAMIEKKFPEFVERRNGGQIAGAHYNGLRDITAQVGAEGMRTVAIHENEGIGSFSNRTPEIPE